VVEGSAKGRRVEVGMTSAELNGGDEMLDVGVSSGPAEVVITANG
jgi:hypothetical protein